MGFKMVKCPDCGKNIMVYTKPRLNYPIVEGLSLAESEFIDDMVKWWYGSVTSPDQARKKLTDFLLLRRQELNK